METHQVLEFGLATVIGASEIWGARAIAARGRDLQYLWDRRDQRSDITQSTEMTSEFKSVFATCTAWFELQWRAGAGPGVSAGTVEKIIKTDSDQFVCYCKIVAGHAYVSISRLPLVKATRRVRPA